MKITHSIEPLGPGRYRAEIQQAGRLVDYCVFGSERQARKWLLYMIEQIETQPLLDLAGDQPHTLSLEL